MVQRRINVRADKQTKLENEDIFRTIDNDLLISHVKYVQQPELHSRDSEEEIT